jgi:SAM-dependent methyltransferase
MQNRLLIIGLLLWGAAAAAAPPDVRATIASEADAMRALVRTPATHAFLDAARALPAIKPRQVYQRGTDRKALLSAAQFRQLPPAQAKAYAAKTRDEAYYYTTGYGTPVAFARPLDIALGLSKAPLKGMRIVDFGFGSIGHLKMLAAAGAHVTGIDVDPRLASLYADPSDTGPSGAGSVALHFGRFPALNAELPPGPFDVFITKNTLKRGYIHPERPAKPEHLIDLGCSDARFLLSVAGLLKAGGLFVIYNISPPQAPADKPYIPWADGRSPFDRKAIESAGFEVLAFDVDDSATVHQMAKLLNWGDAGQTFVGTYTVLRKMR